MTVEPEPPAAQRREDAAEADGGAVIALRVERVSQLFNMLDPFPFRERDLDAAAEEFIVGWARELPAGRPIHIVVHLPADLLSTPEVQGLGEALRHFFSYRADVIARELKEMFRIGRRSLAIGLAVLGLCLALARAVSAHLGPSAFGSVVVEGLIILGWVANWRPLEIFLYDWWPLDRRRRLYLRLAAADVRLTAFAPAGTASPPEPAEG